MTPISKNTKKIKKTTTGKRKLTVKSTKSPRGKVFLRTQQRTADILHQRANYSEVVLINLDEFKVSPNTQTSPLAWDLNELTHQKSDH